MVQNVIFHKLFRVFSTIGLIAGLLLIMACTSELEGAPVVESDASTFLVDAEGVVSLDGVPITLGRDRISKIEKILGKTPSEVLGVYYWPESGLSGIEKHGCLQKIMVALRPEKTMVRYLDGKEILLGAFGGKIAVTDVQIYADKSIRELNSVSSVKFSQYGPSRVRYSIPDSEGVSVYLDYGKYEHRMSNLKFSVSKNKWGCSPFVEGVDAN